MFAFFMVSYAGTAFFREHVWATWDRVRCTPASPLEMALGKIISPFALLCVQQAVLMVIGATLFGLHLAGSWATFALVDLSFTLWLTALIFATITFCQSLQQVLAISNLGALVFAGLGGALTPLKTLPHWAQTIAPASPIYWAMRGFKQVALQGGGLGTVAPSLAVLAGSALLIGAASALRFKVDAEKGGTLIA